MTAPDPKDRASEKEEALDLLHGAPLEEEAEFTLAALVREERFQASLEGSLPSHYLISMLMRRARRVILSLRAALRSPEPESKMASDGRIYYSDGSYLQGWRLGEDRVATSFDAENDVPEAVAECAPVGWSVWDGTVRRLTREDMDGEEGDTYRHEGYDAGDEWWSGELRAATADEVVDFFGLHRAPTGEPEEER